MYDPIDFAHGIDQLAQAEERGDVGHRKEILELMLADLSTVGGNLAEELTNYIASLSLFDDPVDVPKLNTLHADLSALWGSSTGYRLEKRIAGTRKPRLQEINDWIARAIKRHPEKTREELWGLASEHYSHLIGRDRFLKRVSAVRKKNKK